MLGAGCWAPGGGAGPTGGGWDSGETRCRGPHCPAAAPRPGAPGARRAPSRGAKVDLRRRSPDGALGKSRQDLAAGWALEEWRGWRAPRDLGAGGGAGSGEPGGGAARHRPPGRPAGRSPSQDSQGKPRKGQRWKHPLLLGVWPASSLQQPQLTPFLPSTLWPLHLAPTAQFLNTQDFGAPKGGSPCTSPALLGLAASRRRREQYPKPGWTRWRGAALGTELGAPLERAHSRCEEGTWWEVHRTSGSAQPWPFLKPDLGRPPPPPSEIQSPMLSPTW